MIIRLFSREANGLIVYGGIFIFQPDVLGHPAAAAQGIGYDLRNSIIPIQFDFFGLMIAGFILNRTAGFIFNENIFSQLVQVVELAQFIAVGMCDNGSLWIDDHGIQVFGI